jgi:hypothetical protein
MLAISSIKTVTNLRCLENCLPPPNQMLQFEVFFIQFVCWVQRTFRQTKKNQPTRTHIMWAACFFIHFCSIQFIGISSTFMGIRPFNARKDPHEQFKK